MGKRGGNAPAWLFSFVDLAFLMLIAMTQVASRASGPDLGEVLVPRLQTEATVDLPTDAPARWQLRVHPVEEGEPAFELVQAADAAAPSDGERMLAASLRTRLAELAAASEEKPLLAPHRNSRSEDLLTAAGLLEEQWPRRRRATVLPTLAQR
ncbi:MAG: hypothetical protein QNK04_17640 [Myxococcota bacterium]|nr:hypothetical protein [Myxococcota bacterium]